MSETVCTTSNQTKLTNNTTKKSKQPSVCEIVKLSHWFECARLLCVLFVRFCCFSTALCSHYYHYSSAFASADRSLTDHIQSATIYGKKNDFNRMQRLRYDTNTIELKFEI